MIIAQLVPKLVGITPVLLFSSCGCNKPHQANTCVAHRPEVKVSFTGGPDKQKEEPACGGGECMKHNAKLQPKLHRLEYTTIARMLSKRVTDKKLALMTSSKKKVLTSIAAHTQNNPRSQPDKRRNRNRDKKRLESGTANLDMMTSLLLDLM